MTAKKNTTTAAKTTASAADVPTMADASEPSAAATAATIPAATADRAARRKEKILEVRNLSVDFKVKKGYFRAVDKVNFFIYRGETFGLVGESGSGKTTIGRAIVRINETSEGDILFEGKKINGRISSELDREVIHKIQMIFQDPMASLNERAKIDYIVSEGLYSTGGFKTEAERKAKVEKALLEVGLLPEFACRFPHEFSGGQRQRIGIARALIMSPELLVADEPISALDVSIRAQVLNLLSQLQKTRGLTLMFIAHDLSVVRFITDRIAVIHLGKIVELGETEEIFSRPLHPYTRALLSAIPLPDPKREKGRRAALYSPGCHDYAENPPDWIEAMPGHFVYANGDEVEAWSAPFR